MHACGKNEQRGLALLFQGHSCSNLRDDR